MNPAPLVIVHPSQDLLSRGVASRLITHLVERQSLPAPTGAAGEATFASGGQSAGGLGGTSSGFGGAGSLPSQSPPAAPSTGLPALHISVTGGGLGQSIWPDLVSHPAAAAVDWSRVHVWFSDERFVAQGDADRNDRAALAAITALGLPPAQVHSVAGPNVVPDVEAAATAYARELAAWSDRAEQSAAPPPANAHELPAPSEPADQTAGVAAPLFVVTILGLGPDGHVASLFPGRHAGVGPATTLAVTDSAKPPPQRVSFTRSLLNHCEELWLIAAGPDKATAVSRALHDDDPDRTPAAGLRGRRRTLWLVDAALAARLS